MAIIKFNRKFKAQYIEKYKIDSDLFPELKDKSKEDILEYLNNTDFLDIKHSDGVSTLEDHSFDEDTIYSDEYKIKNFKLKE